MKKVKYVDKYSGENFYEYEDISEDDLSEIENRGRNRLNKNIRNKNTIRDYLEKSKKFDR